MRPVKYRLSPKPQRKEIINMINVISAAYYSNDKEVQNAVLKSDEIRDKTLNACYEIPGYESLSLTEKNRHYDRIKAQFIVK
jgi:hypothetical protein